VAPRRPPEWSTQTTWICSTTCNIHASTKMCQHILGLGTHNADSSYQHKPLEYAAQHATYTHQLKCANIYLVWALIMLILVINTNHLNMQHIMQIRMHPLKYFNLNVCIVNIHANLKI
jgi:hypothetical protein